MSCQCLLRGGNMDKLQECFPTMHLSSALSDCSDDSNKSIGIPPSFSCDGNQTEGILKWELMNDDLKSSIEELNSELDRNHQTLDDKIKELDDAVDELESVHKNSIMVSLVGSSVGAAGGIAAIAGACFAPFTLGASLALTGVGAVAGVAGGVTSGASNFTNKVRQKTLREKIENIISELQNTIKPMLKLLRKIDNITEDIKLVEQTLKKQKKKERSARDGSEEVIKIVGVADLAILGKLCAEAAKEIRVYVKAVKAVRGPASAARAVRATAETTTFFRTASAFAGALSAVFLALDVYSIVQDSVELSEMNQPADKRKEEISSETLKFILQTKAAADQFKKTVGKIKDAVDSTVL